MICETIDLGQFDGCEPVEIPEITDVVTLRNEITRWECEVMQPDIGQLVKGHYTFEINGQRYKFEVV